MSTLSRSASLRLFPLRPIAHAQLSLCRESQLRGASRTGGKLMLFGAKPDGEFGFDYTSAVQARIPNGVQT